MEKIEQEEEEKRERFLKEKEKLDQERKNILLREQEKKRRTLREKLLKEKEKKEQEKKHFEELLAKEKERIKKKKEMENQENNDSTENKNTINDNQKLNLKLRNNPGIKKNNLQNLRSKLYGDKNLNKINGSIKKNNTELNNNYKGNNFHTLSTNKKNETIDKETDAEDNIEEKNISRRLGLSTGKHEKFMKVKFGDPLNPYMTNWPSSFLKIGYNVGFHFNQYQKGVPLLRIQKLKKNVVFPPLYTIQYNKYTDDKNQISNETEKLCCNSVVKKLFNPMRTRYGFSESQKNKSKQSYQTYYNKAFLPKDVEIINKQLENKLNSEKNLYELKDKDIITENKEDNKNINKEMLILDNNNNKQEKQE